MDAPVRDQLREAVRLRAEIPEAVKGALWGDFRAYQRTWNDDRANRCAKAYNLTWKHIQAERTWWLLNRKPDRPARLAAAGALGSDHVLTTTAPVEAPAPSVERATLKPSPPVPEASPAPLPMPPKWNDELRHELWRRMAFWCGPVGGTEALNGLMVVYGLTPAQMDQEWRAWDAAGRPGPPLGPTVPEGGQSTDPVPQESTDEGTLGGAPREEETTVGFDWPSDAAMVAEADRREAAHGGRGWAKEWARELGVKPDSLANRLHTARERIKASAKAPGPEERMEDHLGHQADQTNGAGSGIDHGEQWKRSEELAAGPGSDQPGAGKDEPMVFVDFTREPGAVATEAAPLAWPEAQKGIAPTLLAKAAEPVRQVPPIMAQSVLFVERTKFGPGELEELLRFAREKIFGYEVTVELEAVNLMAIRPAL